MSVSKIENIVVSLAIISTVLSFSESDTVSYFCSVLMYVFWVGVLLLTAVQRNIQFNRFMVWMISVYIFWSFCSWIFAWIGIYKSSNIGVVSYLLYCVAFYLMGFNYRYGDETVFKRLIIAFSIGQIILMATMTLHLGHATNEGYMFKAKNQMGQMLGIGIVIELFILPRYIRSFFLRILYMSLGAGTFIVLLYIHSRTPVVAIAVIAVYMFILRKGKRARDYVIGALAIIILSGIINHLGGMAYLQGLFNASQGVSGSNINQMTSGRWELFGIAISDFLSSPICGIGAYAYVDSFFFNTLRCGGLLLAFLIFPLSYGKLFTSFRSANKLQKTFECTQNIEQRENTDIFLMTVKVMMLYYFVVSLMEGYPPLGPGSSVFFFWILLGMLDKTKKEAYS